MKFCPECGKKLLLSNPKHCPECGAAISSAVSKTAGGQSALQQSVSISSSKQPSAPAVSPPAFSKPAPASPPGVFRRFWAWFVAIFFLLLLLLPIAAFIGEDSALKKSARLETEQKLAVRLAEEKQLMAAQRKIMVATTISQYSAAIQTDAIAVDILIKKAPSLQNASFPEQTAYSLEFAGALRDVVDHAQEMKVFTLRERAALDAAGSDTALVLEGLNATETQFKALASGVLESMEKEASSNETAKQVFGGTIKVLQNIG